MAVNKGLGIFNSFILVVNILFMIALIIILPVCSHQPGEKLDTAILRLALSFPYHYQPVFY